MSKQQRELVDQIAWIMVQANNDPSIMFDKSVDPAAAHEALFFLDDFNQVLLEYRASLSVAQAIRNASGYAMMPDEIAKLYPDLARESEGLPFSPIRPGPSILGLVAEGKSEEAVKLLADSLVPSDASILKDNFERQSIAAKAPVFTMPKGIKSAEFRKVCDDIQLLAACHQQSWQYVFDPDRVLNEDEDVDDLPSDQDRLGFHGCFQWLSNVVDAVRSQFDNKSAYLEASSVTKVAPGKFKPPGSALN